MISYVKIGILYIVLTGFILITNNVNEPLYALKSILIPYDYEKEKIIFINLVINYSFIIIFITNIIKSCSSLFSIQGFIHQRCNKKIAYKVFLKKISINIFIILLIKLGIDILMGGLASLTDYMLLLKIYMLYLLTIVIWMLIIFILYMFYIKEKIINFSMITIIFIFQYISFYMPYLDIFAIASKDTLVNFGMVIIAKVILASLLLTLSYFKFKKYEVIGGVKGD